MTGKSIPDNPKLTAAVSGAVIGGWIASTMRPIPGAIMVGIVALIASLVAVKA